jgi:hypothetical protein
MEKKVTAFYVAIGISVLIIIVLATGAWNWFTTHETEEETKTKIIAPLESSTYVIASPSGLITWEGSLNTKMPLESGEIVIAVLNRENAFRTGEEQFVIYSNINSASLPSPVYITFLSFDERTGGYRRMWSAPTAATRPETATIFSQDLIGDRNNCIIVTGMNANNEHTMTVFRARANQRPDQAYNKIAELQISGSIIIQERARTLAYQQGIARGQSYNIAAYGHDTSSSNMLDQIEIIYSFNPNSEQYEQINVSRIPGAQIEQRQLRELLSGRPGVFENFIHDLWYYVSPRGTIDAKQYLYFDPAGREILFYGDEAQQVFRWQSSTPTRNGLYIRSQNISISTLLRFIDIELESLNSIRIRVTEDVRLKILVSTTWDGTYRRAGTANFQETVSRTSPTVDAVYDSSWGRIQFNISGEYSINSGNNTRGGRYVFYNVNGDDLLELRPRDGDENRMIYKIETGASSLILTRVQLGISGIQNLLEPQVILTPVEL